MKKIVIICVVLFLLTAGCLHGSEEQRTKEYADPIANQLIKGMQQDNYTLFSEKFTPTMKKALPEETFYEVNDMLMSTVGKPVSLEFLKSVEGERFVTIVYTVTFEDGSEGLFSIALKEENGETKVAGAWIDSPKLRQEQENVTL